MTCILFKVRKTDSQQLGARKNFPQLFGIEKNWFLAILSLTKTVAAIWREKQWMPAIWRLNKVVHNCYEQGKRL